MKELLAQAKMNDGTIVWLPISEHENKDGYVSYLSMVKWCTDGAYILNNTVISLFDDWERESGNDYNEETDEYYEVFQYFIIDGHSAEMFEKYTDEIVYYSETADMYLLGVTHFGTAWDYVPSGWKIVAVSED